MGQTHEITPMNIIFLANKDKLALGLGTYFGGGKYIWYKGCFSNHFSASSLDEPDALDNF